MSGVLQVGCGADELIDLLMRCVLDPGDAIVDCPPTFGMYTFDADVNNCRTITVPRLEGFRIDVEGGNPLLGQSADAIMAPCSNPCQLNQLPALSSFPCDCSPFRFFQIFPHPIFSRG